jgi:hypothetical protein
MRTAIFNARKNMYKENLRKIIAFTHALICLGPCCYVSSAENELKCSSGTLLQSHLRAMHDHIAATRDTFGRPVRHFRLYLVIAWVTYSSPIPVHAILTLLLERNSGIKVCIAKLL